MNIFRTRNAKRQRFLRRIWRFYAQRGGHYSFNWPGFINHQRMEIANS